MQDCLIAFKKVCESEWFLGLMYFPQCQEGIVSIHDIKDMGCAHLRIGIEIPLFPSPQQLSACSDHRVFMVLTMKILAAD